MSHSLPLFSLKSNRFGKYSISHVQLERLTTFWIEYFVFQGNQVGFLSVMRASKIFHYSLTGKKIIIIKTQWPQLHLQRSTLISAVVLLRWEGLAAGIYGRKVAEPHPPSLLVTQKKFLQSLATGVVLNHRTALSLNCCWFFWVEMISLKHGGKPLPAQKVEACDWQRRTT